MKQPARVFPPARGESDIALLSAAGASITHGRLEDYCEAVRTVLTRYTRRLVLCLMERSVPGVACYLGALRSPHAVMPVEQPSREELVVLIRRFVPELIIAPKSAPLDPIRSRADYAIASELRAPPILLLTCRQLTHPQRHVHPELCLLLRTSGTLGFPKVVRLSYENVRSNAQAIATVKSLSPRDVGVTSLPLDFSFGLSILHSHILAGAAILLTQARPTSRLFWAQASRAGVTNICLVPHSCRFLRSATWGLSGTEKLRLICQAGGSLDSETKQYFIETAERNRGGFAVMYGQTEATARISYLPPRDARARFGSVGQAIPGGALAIDRMGDHGEEAGEVVYNGPNVMMGYAWSRDDLAKGDELKRELRTGDLGVLVDDYLYLRGRKDRMVKLAGRRVQLEEVEEHIDASGEVAAIATNEKLTLYTTGDGRDIEPQLRLLEDKLGLPARTVTLARVDFLPRTRTGKVDYRALGAIA